MSRQLVESCSAAFSSKLRHVSKGLFPGCLLTWLLCFTPKYFSSRNVVCLFFCDCQFAFLELFSEYCTGDDKGFNVAFDSRSLACMKLIWSCVSCCVLWYSYLTVAKGRKWDGGRSSKKNAVIAVVMGPGARRRWFDQPVRLKTVTRCLDLVCARFDAFSCRCQSFYTVQPLVDYCIRVKAQATTPATARKMLALWSFKSGGASTIKSRRKHWSGSIRRDLPPWCLICTFWVWPAVRRCFGMPEYFVILVFRLTPHLVSHAYEAQVK